MKRFLSILIIATLLFSTVTPVFANDKLPSAIWSLFKEEADLGESDDLYLKIKNWYKIISLFDSWEDTNQKKLEIITPRLRKIAESYEELFEYDKAVITLKDYKYYATILEENGSWDGFAKIWAESKIINLSVELDLYVRTIETETAVYYGAKHEPQTGVIYGATYDIDPRINSYARSRVKNYFPKKDSAYLIYLEFENKINDYDRFYQQAKSSNTAVSLAWNAYEVYDDMSVNKGYIEETARYLKNLDIPVFLRYGSEFNTAEGFEDADKFVENFKYVVDTVREIAPNVAIVWSPNDVTNSDRNLEDYYPGDEYVDWVGMSTYTYYYFGDKTDWGDMQESLDNQFFTGNRANPVNKVAEVIELFGDRKPIMISENGIAHYSKVANEDMTDWALIQLRRAYEYIPLKYPQVKAMFYFNVDNDIATKRSSYALFNNKEINDTYNELVSYDGFLSDVDEVRDSYYKKVSGEETISLTVGENIDIKTLAMVPNELELKVVYSLNGEVIQESEQIPYGTNLTIESIDNDSELMIQVFNTEGRLIKEDLYLLTINTETNKLTVKPGLIVLLDEENPLGSIEIFEAYIFGYSDNSFKSDSNVTRAEVATMLARVLHLNTDYVGSQKFDDVDSNHWAYKYVQAIYRTGIFKGYEDGTFDPDAPITRAEIAQVFSDYFKFLDIPVTDIDPSEILDVESNYWASDAINKLFDTDLFIEATGNTFRPNDLVSRHQIVVMINNLTGRPATRPEQSKFSDVFNSNPAFGDIESASEFFINKRNLGE